MHVVLADREAEIMQVLWEHGPSTVSDVRKHLTDNLAYTTVLTILRTLESKGYVGHQSEGKAHRYSALVKREAARRSALLDLSTKLFQGSMALLLVHLVSDQRLSDGEVARIRRLLREQRKKDRQ